MNMVKPCSKDSKNIVFNAFKTEFEEVSASLELDPAAVDGQQAEMVLLELGFINEKQNEDIEMAAELIA